MFCTTPARSARAVAHSAGVTLPFVGITLTMRSRRGLAKGTSGGAALRETPHATTITRITEEKRKTMVRRRIRSTRPRAVIEKELPLGPLYLARCVVCRSPGLLSRGFAEIDEPEGIPCRPEVQSGLGTLLRYISRSLKQGREDV